MKNCNFRAYIKAIDANEIDTLKLFLAPMEGVVDSIMRRVLTEIGGLDACVTEFMRVTSVLEPRSVFYRYCPELKSSAKTKSGVPVNFQILGGDPEVIVKNAKRAVELGATAIDLNFGCPAKTVNRHDGGASLLQYPERLYKIIHTLRQSLASEIPVSAKVRLGFKDKSLAIENALAVEAAKADFLTIHARTKVEAYRPPAHWEWIAKIKEHVSIPIVANGDIWSLEDFIRCYTITRCQQFMLGRGMIANPFLALEIKHYWQQQNNFTRNNIAIAEHNNMDSFAYAWGDVQPYVRDFFQSCCELGNEKYAVARTKQWTKLMSRNFSESEYLFSQIKRMQLATDVMGCFA